MALDKSLNLITVELVMEHIQPLPPEYFPTPLQIIRRRRATESQEEIVATEAS